MGIDIVDQVRWQGWTGPVALLSDKEITLISRCLNDSGRNQSNMHLIPSGWGKGLAVTDRLIFELARDERILSHLRPLLGPDIILWGASVIDRGSGMAHPWHTDIETAASSGNAISVWVALENASKESSLAFIPGSHLFGKTIQEVAKHACVPRESRSKETALELAKLFSERVMIEQPSVNNGQMLIFDGRVWHGSFNNRRSGVRRALVLQYAAPELPIRIPNWSQLDWPFELKKSPRPPVLLVSGSNVGDNRLESPPSGRDESQSALKNLTVPIPDPLPRNAERGWRPNPLYKGSTPVLSKLTCHASILEPGCMPHPPHCHLDEEILIILSGKAEVVIAISVDDPSPRVETMTAGDMIYYPSYQYHTIRCVGETPVSYFMYRWNAPCRFRNNTLEVTVLKGLSDITYDKNKRFVTSKLFEAETGLLDKLHAHMSYVKPGGGYAEHRDEHDVAILLLEGAIETMGKIISAPAVVMYPAKELHGLRGAGGVTARYLVIEFHGAHAEPRTYYERLRQQGLVMTENIRMRLRRRWRYFKRKLVHK